MASRSNPQQVNIAMAAALESISTARKNRLVGGYLCSWVQFLNELKVM